MPKNLDQSTTADTDTPHSEIIEIPAEQEARPKEAEPAAPSTQAQAPAWNLGVAVQVVSTDIRKVQVHLEHRPKLRADLVYLER